MNTIIKLYFYFTKNNPFLIVELFSVTHNQKRKNRQCVDDFLRDFRHSIDNHYSIHQFSYKEQKKVTRKGTLKSTKKP